TSTARRSSSEACTSALAASTERRTRPNRSISHEAPRPNWYWLYGLGTLIAGKPGRLSVLNRVKSEPVGVDSLSRCRLQDAFADTCGHRLAEALSRCRRASVIRSTAARSSRLEALERSMSEVNPASLKRAHQSSRWVGSVLTTLVTPAAWLVAAPDQCAGSAGRGGEKLGPTAQPASSAAGRSLSNV